MLRALWMRFRALLGRDAVDQGLADEMGFHQEMLVRDGIAAGLTPEAAQAAARRKFGNPTTFREDTREVLTWPRFESVLHDLHLGFRMLGRSPAMALAVILTLALAIGANTAIFGLVDALLLTPLPVEHPEQLYFMSHTMPDGSADTRFSFPAVLRLRQASNQPILLAASDFTRLSVAVDGHAEPGEGMLVSGDFFAVLGLRAAEGRLLTPGDDTIGRPAVAVLSDRYWRHRFAAAPNALGRVIDLDGVPTTIVGILPPQFTGFTVGRAEGDLWLPLSLHPQFGLRDHTDVDLIARVGRETDAQAAAASLTAAFRGYVADSEGPRPTTLPREAQAPPRVNLASAALGEGSDVGPQLPILLVAGLLVLIVVCANLANLLLSRAVARRREVAIRLALGASGGRLVQQLLAESLVLAVLGAGLGAVLATWGADGLARYLASDPESVTVRFTFGLATTPRLFGFTAALTVFVTAAFALIPALSFRRSDVHAALKAGAPGSRGSRSVLRIGRGLVVAQVALSMLLLLTAGTLVRSVRHLKAIDPGFDRDHVLVFMVYPTMLGYRDNAELALYDRLRHAIEAIPGVEAVSMSRSTLARDGRQPCAPRGHPEEIQSDDEFPVGPGFFATMRVPLLVGREFSDGDRPTTTPVAVLSQTAARAYFPDGPAVGRTLRAASVLGAAPLQVVGVVRDVQTYDLVTSGGVGANACDLYIPVSQAPARRLGQLRFEVRTANPALLLPAVRRTVLQADPNLALFWPTTEAEEVRQLYGRRSSVATLAGAFGVLALIFASVGLFGIISYAVTSRTSELGLRIALGARPGTLIMSVLRETITLTLVGIAIGTGASVATLSITRGLLFGVQPLDPVAAAAALGILVAVSVASASTPALRAARLDPVVALRAE